MDLSPSAEQQLVADTARTLSSRRIAAEAVALDRGGAWPQSLWRELGELGLLGIAAPAERGGSGAGWVAATLALSELSRGCGSLGTAAALTNVATELVGGGALSMFGADAGTPLAGWLDGSAGPAALVRADVRGCQPVLGGGRASHALVLASGGGLRLYAAPCGPSTALEPTGLRGLGLAQLAARPAPPAGATAPAGGADRALRERTLDALRTALAAVAHGLATAALEATVTYTKQREQFGRAIADFQAVQFTLADMATDVEALRVVTLAAAAARDHDAADAHARACSAHAFAVSALWRVAERAVQLHGGYGYTDEFPVERLFRDARTLCAVPLGGAERRAALAGALVPA